MTEHEHTIMLLIQAIEDIQHNWSNGDLADAVRNAIAIKDEACQTHNIPSTDSIVASDPDRNARDPYSPFYDPR